MDVIIIVSDHIYLTTRRDAWMRQKNLNNVFYLVINNIFYEGSSPRLNLESEEKEFSIYFIRLNQMAKLLSQAAFTARC